MKLGLASSSLLAVLLALASANVGLVLFVTAMDALIGCPPQYSVPMFLPLAVGFGALVLSLRLKRAAISARGNPSSTPSSAKGGALLCSPAKIRSAVIIRRRLALSSEAEQRRAYSEVVF